MRGKINWMLFACLMLSWIMSACATTAPTRGLVGQPDVVAAPVASPQKTVLKDTRLIQPVDVRVGSAVEARDPLKIETLTGNGTVVAPVQVDVTVPGTSWQTYAIAGGVVAGGTFVVLFLADQAGAFDTQTTLIGARPAR